MKLLRLALIPGLAFAVAACGTKAPLVTPQCSKEERTESGTPAPANQSKACGKLSKGPRNPSEPNNPISR